MNKEINILSMFRNKNMLSFFSIHQLYNKIKSYDSNIKIKFHIIWDDNKELGGYDKKYSNLIDLMFGDIITSYNKEFLNSYCKKYYNISDTQIKLFDNFYLIYRILLGHYLRRVKLIDYFIILDDDILINCDLNEIINYSINNIPFLISETMNVNCDKSIFTNIASIYENGDFFEKYKSKNPLLIGFNAGFQGIDASIFDDFLSTSFFNILISLFNYKSIKNIDGTEIFGNERFIIDTQEQYFFSCMNITKSKNSPVILNTNEYFIIPNWGDHPIFGTLSIADINGVHSPDEEWRHAFKSKITHFIGHTNGEGKPKIYINKVNEYLTKNNL